MQHAVDELIARRAVGATTRGAVVSKGFGGRARARSPEGDGGRRHGEPLTASKAVAARCWGGEALPALAGIRAHGGACAPVRPQDDGPFGFHKAGDREQVMVCLGKLDGRHELELAHPALGWQLRVPCLALRAPVRRVAHLMREEIETSSGAIRGHRGHLWCVAHRDGEPGAGREGSDGTGGARPLTREADADQAIRGCGAHARCFRRARRHEPEHKFA